MTGLDIYVVEPEKNLERFSSEKVDKDILVLMYLMQLILPLGKRYREDGALRDKGELNFNIAVAMNCITEALEHAESQLSSNNGLAGFDRTTRMAGFFFQSLRQGQPLRWKSTVESATTDGAPPWTEAKLNAIFALELGWIVKRFLMYSDLMVTEAEMANLIQGLIQGALLEFRSFSSQVNDLTASVMEAHYSVREVMLHYECMISKLKRVD